MALTKEQIKEFEEREKAANDSYGFRSVADDIAEAGDKEWAEKNYKIAEEKSEDQCDFSDLAGSILEKLNDKKWAKKVYEKAESNSEDCSDFRSLADNLCEKLKDKEWAKKVYKKSEEITDNFNDFNDLAESLCENLGDKKWAKLLYKKAEAEAESVWDFRSFAESLCQKLGDKEWAKKVYKKVESKTKNSNEVNDLAKSLLEIFGDAEWSGKLLTSNNLPPLEKDVAVKKVIKKTYRVFYYFEFSPDKHFGVDRKKCKCGICPKKIIRKEDDLYVSDGDSYNNDEDGNESLVKDVDTAYDYLMSKYEGDNFDNYGYFDEETNNPNGNDESEFSDGFGDEELNIYKIEVLDYESEKIIETHNM